MASNRLAADSPKSQDSLILLCHGSKKSTASFVYTLLLFIIVCVHVGCVHVHDVYLEVSKS